MIFFLWLAQIVEDVSYLYRAEFLRPFGVAALHQNIVERLAAVDPLREWRQGNTQELTLAWNNISVPY